MKAVDSTGNDWAAAMQAAEPAGRRRSSDTTLVTMGVLCADHEAAPLFYEACCGLGFESSDWNRVRGERLASLEQKNNEPARVADRVLRSGLFGAVDRTVAGHKDRQRRCKKLSASDLRAFHQSFYPPRGWKIVVAGDFELSQTVADKLLGTLGKLPLNPPSSPLARPMRTPPKPQKGPIWWIVRARHKRKCASPTWFRARAIPIVRCWIWPTCCSVECLRVV